MLNNNVLYLLILLLALGLVGTHCGKRPLSFETLSKIDSHVHIRTSEPSFIEQAQADNFRLLTIVTCSASQQEIDQQLHFAQFQQEKFPATVAFTTTFSMEGWGTPAWQSRTIERLKKDFEAGAIAVKVWKDIGMTFRDSSGNFIMIDDPAFDPILDFIAAENKTLVAHLGEPKNCWLPLDSMTVNNDRNYFKNHPQYHMYLHPDYPSYNEQIAARDRMLAKHPTLRVVGAHLGSLEWDVAELAKRLEQYPNFAVDLAARICHLQVQPREKVRNFMKQYQDRILYGTDIIVNENTNVNQLKKWVHETWWADWQFFSTDSVLTSDNVNNPFKGLKLEESVLKKIYFENAKKWFPGIFN